MNFSKTLSRDEMKNIMAGGCRIATRNADGSWAGYLPGCHSYEIASLMYESEEYDNDSQTYVSGYCCTSCGEAGFSNTDSC